MAASAVLFGSARADDLIIADFEGTDYGSWKSTGEAFGTAPARGSLPGQMQVDGFKGKGLVNSFHKVDGTTGTLTSPEFKIERRYIGFLIGGGKNTETLALNLLVDGKLVRSATGPNDRPSGGEMLAPESWEVDKFAGQTAVLQIIDNATGGWGHINVDHLVQTAKKWVLLAANGEYVIGPRHIRQTKPMRTGLLEEFIRKHRLKLENQIPGNLRDLVQRVVQRRTFQAE
jgi:fructan beta-fructosidase